MKRVLLLAVVVLMIGSNVTEAHYSHHVPLRYRARYCPYVGDLVPADMVYRPYAFDYHHSGLVPYWVDYCPYALSPKNPYGLIDVYSGQPYYSSYRGHCFPQASSQPVPSFEEMRKSYEEDLRVRQERTRKLAESREELNTIREKDGSEIISRYFKSKNIDFRTRNGFRTGNKIVSIDFILWSKNITVRYQNPEEIQALSQTYRQKWEDFYSFCSQGQTDGSKIYEIKSASAGDILSKLKYWFGE